MTLDPQIAAIVDTINGAGAPEYCDMTVEQARWVHEDTAGRLGAAFVELARVTDLVIPGAAGDILARVYDPTQSDGSPAGVLRACLVFYHGGGHVIGSLDSYDTLCRQLASQSRCMVLSIDYRMGPEHRFTAAVDDAYDAYAWTLANCAALGIDPSRLAVGGDSAGGNLAAVVVNLARNRGLAAPSMQLLVYPATGAYPSTASQFAFAEKHVLTRRLILWFHAQYLCPEDYSDPRWAPLLEPDLRGSPPTLMILAECDPLRDEGLQYGVRLAEAGADVVLRVYAGTVHPFFSWSRQVDLARQAVAFAAEQIRTALAAPLP